MLVYWLIFAAFAAGALSYASGIARGGLAPLGGSAAAMQSRRSIVLGVAAIALLLLIGLRYRVGGDWPNYAEVYRYIASQELWYALTTGRQEPGFTLINWLGTQFGLSIWFVNLICAVPFTYGLMQVCRQQPNPWLALLVATPFLIVVVGMGYTRQAAALGCLMAGLASLIDRRPPMRFVAWVILGALFHRTVLVFIPIMFIGGTSNKLVSYSLVVLSVVLAYFTVLPAAIDLYAPGYIHEEISAAGAAVRVLMDVVPAAMVILFGRRFFWSAEERGVWRTYAILCLVAGLALPFIHSSVIVDRLAIYLIPMQIFVYARAGYAFGLIQRGWLMWTTAVIVYSAAVMFVWLNYAINAYAWLPYQNYLTFPERM